MIDLSDTDFRVSTEATWETVGFNATADIRFSDVS